MFNFISFPRGLALGKIVEIAAGMGMRMMGPAVPFRPISSGRFI